MNDLSDDEAALLLRELDGIIESDKFFIAAHSDVESDPA
jgi:hypothetical protein